MLCVPINIVAVISSCRSLDFRFVSTKKIVKKEKKNKQIISKK